MAYLSRIVGKGLWRSEFGPVGGGRKGKIRDNSLILGSQCSPIILQPFTGAGALV